MISRRAQIARNADRPKSSASGNPIKVVIRLRERNERESNLNDEIVVSKADNQTVQVKYRGKDRKYTYSAVMGGMHTQADVYQDLAGSVASDLLIGKSSSIMAYGQTGTGKTYTVMGSQRSPTDDATLLLPCDGLVPRLLFDLFQKIEASGADCIVTCQYIEIYNENLRDLLSYETKSSTISDSTIGTRNLRLIDGSSSGVIQGAIERVVSSAPQAVSLISNANMKRQMASTELNAESSRSHALLTISVTSRQRHLLSQPAFTSKVRLIDLAGSENIARAKSNKERSIEAGQINQSLLALGRVISALAEGCSHIPFRDSKLTRLLRDALCGGSSTTLIATLSPCKSDIEASISTLEYSSRASLIAPRRGGESDGQNFTTLEAMGKKLMQLQHEVDMHRQKDGYTVITTEEYYDLVEKAKRESQASGDVKASREKVVSLQHLIDKLTAENASLKGSLRAAEASQSELENLNNEVNQRRAENQNLSRVIKDLENAATTSSQSYEQSLNKVQLLLDGEKRFTESVSSLLKEACIKSTRLVDQFETESGPLKAGDPTLTMREKQVMHSVIVAQALERFQSKIKMLIVERSKLAASELGHIEKSLRSGKANMESTMQILLRDVEASQFRELSELADKDQRSIQEVLTSVVKEIEKQSRDQILMHEKAISNIKASTSGVRLYSLSSMVRASFSKIQTQTRLFAEDSTKSTEQKLKSCRDGLGSAETALQYAHDATQALGSQSLAEQINEEVSYLRSTVEKLEEKRASELLTDSAVTLDLAKSILNQAGVEAKSVKNIIASSLDKINERGEEGKQKQSSRKHRRTSDYEVSVPSRSSKRKSALKQP